MAIVGNTAKFGLSYSGANFGFVLGGGDGLADPVGNETGLTEISGAVIGAAVGSDLGEKGGDLVKEAYIGGRAAVLSESSNINVQMNNDLATAARNPYAWKSMFGGE